MPVEGEGYFGQVLEAGLRRGFTEHGVLLSLQQIKSETEDPQTQRHMSAVSGILIDLINYTG